MFSGLLTRVDLLATGQQSEAKAVCIAYTLVVTQLQELFQSLTIACQQRLTACATSPLPAAADAWR